MTFTLASDHRLVTPLVQLVRRTMSEMAAYDDAGRTQVGVALEEALLAALYHGNLELTAEQVASAGYDLLDETAANVIESRRNQLPFRKRRIYVEVHISRSEVRTLIRHQGPGFTAAPLLSPEEVLARDDRQDRGMVHMSLFMDEFQMDPSGKEILLVKRYDPDTLGQ
jgi:anti-sigma regulatory factor (Ser/Thr protein kinase)